MYRSNVIVVVEFVSAFDKKENLRYKWNTEKTGCKCVAGKFVILRARMDKVLVKDKDYFR